MCSKIFAKPEGMIRFGGFFWDWLARRVFSPNPEGMVLFSFFVSGRTDGQTETENASLGGLKRQLQGGERKKRGAQSVRQSQA